MSTRDGEYTPPGGKLVAADAEVSGGRLERVQIGVPAGPSAEAVTTAVRRALPGPAAGVTTTDGSSWTSPRIPRFT